MFGQYGNANLFLVQLFDICNWFVTKIMSNCFGQLRFIYTSRRLPNEYNNMNVQNLVTSN